jgi:two-component system, NtrC family, sensor kinase
MLQHPLGEKIDQTFSAETSAILDAVVGGVCGVDSEGHATFSNDALAKMTGYRVEEIVGQNVHELLHHSHPDGTRYPAEECALRKAIDDHQPAHLANEFLWRKDRTQFPAEYWMRPLKQPWGRTSYVVTVKDITEIQNARDVLRQSEEKFRRMLASTPDVAWTSNQHGRTNYISPKVLGVLGYTKEEICAGGANLWLGRIHPGDFGRVHQAYEDLFAERRALDEEYRIQRKDGAWIWVHDRAVGTHEEDGVLCADGFLCDITARKQAEGRLRSQTAFLEALANSTIDGFLVVDPFGQMLMKNQRLGELFNIPDELMSQKDDGAMLRHVVKLIKDPEAFLAKVAHLYKHPDETSRDEIELKNGMTLDRYSAPMIDQAGVHYGRIWTFRDISERKRNADALQQLSLAVEQSPVSVVITDPQGNIGYVNRKFTEVTGYSGEEVVGKNPRILNGGRASPDLYANLWATITQGKEWRGEFCNKKKNGEIFWEAATITPMTDEKGIITHFLAVKEDVTERRRAEEGLRASEKRYRLLFERNLAGVLRTTPDGRVLDCNQAAVRMLGYESLEEVQAHPASHFYCDPSDREAFVAKLKSERSFSNHEMKLRRKDGDELWVIASFTVVEDEAGAGGIIEGTLVDITKRKRAEKELRLTQSSLEDASDAIYWMNSQAGIVYANEAACRSLDRSREELLSLSIPDIDPVFHMETWETFWNELKTRGSMTFETRHQSKQGRVFPVEITANYLEFDGQEYSFAFVRDITERKALESQLRHAQKLEGIGQLAAGIAHEINTPTQFVTDNLTFLRDSWTSTYELLEKYREVIRNAGETLPAGMAAALQQSEKGCDLEFIAAEVPRAIDQSLDGARRVAKIVRAMKEFSHPDSADKTATDLNKAIESTITVARNEWKYVSEVVKEFEETLPPVVCYPGDINQVVLNLIVNAAHAIKEKTKEDEKGTITVGTRVRGEDVEISVKDTGNGIPENIRNRVFDPFFTTKEVGKGTGQGLALAYTVVVKKHGGKIWFETEVGQGTTFFITLPIKVAESAKGN